VTELHHEPVLVIGEQFRSTKLLQSACRLAAVEPEIVFECSAGPTLEALVRAGAGIGIVSDAVQRAREDDLVTRPLCDIDGRLLTFELHIAWVRSRILHPAVHEFTRDLSRFTAPIREAQATRTRAGTVG
jgi:DNA-binding transcriptional LysR family regulator